MMACVGSLSAAKVRRCGPAKRDSWSQARPGQARRFAVIDDLAVFELHRLFHSKLESRRC